LRIVAMGDSPRTDALVRAIVMSLPSLLEPEILSRPWR
jgi:hypothetical protein